MQQTKNSIGASLATSLGVDESKVEVRAARTEARAGCRDSGILEADRIVELSHYGDARQAGAIVEETG